MPIIHKPDGWYWGSKGPFTTRGDAQKVANAAYANGYKQESLMSENIVAEFIGTLLHSATLTHFKHFSVTGAGSYAAHQALSTYYDEIVDLVDTVTEAIQGKYQVIISGYPNTFGNTDAEPLAYLLNLKDYVALTRVKLPQDSEIQNEIDNIANLINFTCYKLRFLA